MLLVFVLLIVIGVALIVYGICRSPRGKKPWEEESRVEVVYKVPSVFDHEHRR